MNRLAPCPSCSRHVRATDERCPFCGTARGARAESPLTRPGRTTRSRFVVHGSTLAILGCTGSGAGGPPGDHDAAAISAAAEGGDAEANAAAQADAADATPEAASACVANLATAGFAVANGSFLCLKDGGGYANFSSHADVYCDRATQFCFISGGGPMQDGCHPLSCSQWVTVKAGVCDGGPLRCACLSGAPCVPDFNYCTDDDAGGVTVSCGTCYGAPPARLSA